MQQQEVVENERRKKLIIVTGFGPFSGHEDVNASWEAVKLLPDILTYNAEEFLLEKQEVPVEYVAVDEAVYNIWQRKPELVIHCGVHGSADRIHIEKQAYNHRFTRPDHAGKYLNNGTACIENCKTHSNKIRLCALNVNSIVRSVATRCNNDCLAKASTNVGNYLCGYIYIKSLDADNKRSLFVHVPPVDKPLSSQQTADIIYIIIEECIRQLYDCDCKLTE